MGDAAAGRLLASDHNLEFVDLDRYNVDTSVARLLPVAVARRHHVVPIGRKFGAPVVAIADPNDVMALDTLRATMGREFVAVVAPDDQIEACLDRVYRTDTPTPTTGASPKAPTDNATSSVAGIESKSVPAGVPSVETTDPATVSISWEPPHETVITPDPPPAFVYPSSDDLSGPRGSTTEKGQTPPAGVFPEERSVAAPVEPDQETKGSDELSHFPPLARVLVEGGRVELSTMLDVLAERDRTGQAVARILTVRGLVNESDLMWGMAQEMGLEFVDLDLQSTDFAAAYHLPEATARHHNVLVFGNRDGVPLVAASNPTDVFAMDDLRTIIGRNFITVVATRSQINTYIDRAYHQGGDATEVAQSAASDFDDSFDEDLSNLQAVVDDAPIVRYVNLLVLQALNERASDIHVEPTAENLRIRYRIDGVLHDISTAPRAIAAAVTTRLKVMSDMNIAEHRLPQDGRISLTVGNRGIDLRIATLPTIYGEKVVMRVLDKSNVVLGFEDLGFDDDLLDIYRGIYTKPYGTILVTGPTGSGKTTTLYATLDALNSADKNIITVEDPVELRLKGINQVQLNVKAGLNFAAALKSILRSDPDIVLVGEIRDKETAMMTIEASLTGHLVLATLHTNDSASTPMRLVEMGMEPYLVTSALSAALAQRLARRLCVHCREPYEPTEAEIVAVGWTPEELFADHPNPVLYRPVGCSACSTTGYLGRKALLELLVVTESIEHLIIEGGTADDIHRLAVKQGMVTLRQSGLRKAFEGETTLEEVLRVVA
ncbi:MAG TPA: type II/IV secretion system protein [Acidimicrobiales bacterium]|nr:type II/IV secretion system protein [Acidimicrobiales bacterium]